MRPSCRAEATRTCSTLHACSSRRVADTGINPQPEAVTVQRVVDRNGRRRAGDGVEIGDVELGEAERLVQRPRDLARGRARGQLTDDGAVLVAPARDAADDY